MSLPNCQLSYSAGSSSMDPRGFRLVSGSVVDKVREIVEVFPEIGQFARSDTLIVSAYPAALGLNGFAPFVDTYLHLPVFVRAFALAKAEQTAVLLAAQPLAGADLLLKTCDRLEDLPRHLMWAVGGYYFPQSLERCISERLAQRGCTVQYLYCYGVAEIGHSCLAATQRFECGSPRYRQVASDLRVETRAIDNRLEIARDELVICTDDYAQHIGNEWLITNASPRLHPEVKAELEAWSTTDWLLRTGYMRRLDRVTRRQLRDSAKSNSYRDIEHFEFWRTYGGGFAYKPQWG